MQNFVPKTLNQFGTHNKGPQIVYNTQNSSFGIGFSEIPCRNPPGASTTVCASVGECNERSATYTQWLLVGCQ